MIAVDTNILVYAHRTEFPQHEAARRGLMELAEGVDLWGIPVFCIGEFLRVVTHPAILKPPTPLKSALEAMTALFESTSLRVLMPGDEYLGLLTDILQRAGAKGNLVFDAQIVALCSEQGIRTLWSNDKDFGRFSDIEIRSMP
jgi:toxin-antitoxin system PIN domain toxin